MNNHKQRVKARNNKNSPQKRKKAFGKIFLICFSGLLLLFVIFNLVFVKRETIITNITITDKTLVSQGGENTYFSYSKTGTHTTTIKYSPVFKITAISGKDGEIIFYDTDYNDFYYDTKYLDENKKVSILNKTKIKKVTKLK